MSDVSTWDLAQDKAREDHTLKREHLTKWLNIVYINSKESTRLQV